VFYNDNNSSVKDYRFNFGQDSTFSGLKTTGSANAADANGQGDFYYAPPTNFLALNTSNLPEPAISPADDESPEDYFNTLTWAGNSTDNRPITGLGFLPDLVWIKRRDGADNHFLQDSVRGVDKQVFTNLTEAEFNNTTQVKSFDSDGFTLGTDGGVNFTGRTYVAWNWKASGASVSNNTGSIISTVCANADSGFSILTYFGNTTSGATVGHGLGVKPDIIIFKRRNSATDWHVYHSALPNSENALLYLNTTAVPGVSSQFLNSTQPTDTIITLGNSAGTNGNSMIAYCFAEIEGYSKFGTYVGNNNVDGPFVYTGFRPAFVITKASATTGNWALFDSTRDAFNDNDLNMFYVNANLAESAFAVSPVDLLSNGFKIRHSTADGYSNATGQHVYMAFAEKPFKYANAR
jgi:hypothetical protein